MNTLATKQLIKDITYRNTPCEFTATANIQKFDNQSPYFAITCSIRGGRGQSRIDMGGCLHDEVREYAPEWTKYIKWHLTSTVEPMHYLANALYWAGFSGWCDGGRNDPPNAENLYSTIVYGALDDDVKHTPETMDKATLTEWLTARLPRLMDAFRVDMCELFGEGIRSMLILEG
jgi:hypothetical protein